MISEFSRAFVLASQAHSGQYRRLSKNPFFIHPFRVSEIALKYCEQHPEIHILRTAALLHDILEDTWVTEAFLEEKFDKKIVELVKEVTEDKSGSSKIRHERFKKKLCSVSEMAKILKLCDVLDNLNDPFEGTKWKNFVDKSNDIVLSLKIDKNSKFIEPFSKLKKDVLREIKKYV